MPTPKPYSTVAYGGASTTCPPGHTIEAIKAGIEAGAGMVYIEVRETRDEQLVAWPSMQRLVDDEPIHISDHTLAQWEEIDAQSPIRLASLIEVLEIVALTGIGLAVDLRVPGVENILARLLRKFRLPYSSILVICSTESRRTILHSLDPNLPLAHRFNTEQPGKPTHDVISSLSHYDAVFWPQECWTKEIAKRLKDKGIVTYAGPIHQMAEMRRLRDDIGVDGIVTPNTAYMKEVINGISDLEKAA